ncbi:MAG: hypothetical protein KME60_31930 [Cyanomargarita calcarea GSE-NOS-MK-12-04C]|jgi:predicted aspartyl protease|uniref:Uncharacterized protein n=1 Tax=Cyanomargarita calcarea GSE-NOS-MK-12-04C TaxID=2839659 RepID=A0A951QTM6_9CYAN|nr:hypothetical protein [Cyanomargarita calcarea GSE-NOS-MK-12-04C]
MMNVRFGDNKELFFEIQLVAANNIDDIEVIVPVHVGDNLLETIIGSFWLDIMRLVADKPNGILTLEIGT